MHRILKPMGIAFLALVISMAGGIFWLTRGLDAALEAGPRGLESQLEDGVYEGSGGSGRWENRLEVTVRQGKISGIRILEDVMFSRDPVSRELFARVVEKNDTRVEAVTGATVTCNSYLQAVENALEKRGN